MTVAYGIAVLSLLTVVIFIFSYESMRDLCNRYNKVVDGNRRLVIFTTFLLCSSL